MGISKRQIVGVLIASCVSPLFAATYQRMVILPGQSVRLAPGQTLELQARCMDEQLAAPTTRDTFTQVLNTGGSGAIGGRATAGSDDFGNLLKEGDLRITGVEDPDRNSRIRAAVRNRDIVTALRETDRVRYNAVKVQNRTGAPIYINVERPVLLGGPTHRPFGLEMLDLVTANVDQGSLWRRIGERIEEGKQQKKRALEAARREIDEVFTTEEYGSRLRSSLDSEARGVEDFAWEASRTKAYIRDYVQDLQKKMVFLGEETEATGELDQATRERIQQSGGAVELFRRLGERLTQVQENLNLAGFELEVDGDLGPETSAAVRAFRESIGAKPAEHLDQETERVLRARRQGALSYLEDASLYLEGLADDQFENLKRLNESGRGEESLLFDEVVKREVEQRLQIRLAEVRGQLEELSYSAPEGNGPSEWRSFLRQFQEDQGLEGIGGALDVPTIARIQSLTSELGRPPPELVIEGDEFAAQLGKPGSQLTDRAISSRNDIRTFRVSRELGELVARSFNKFVAADVVDLAPQGDGDALLTVVDTTGYALADAIADVIATESLGIGLATSNGVAVYSPLFDPDTGQALVQVSTEEGTVFENVAVEGPTFWDRVRRFFPAGDRRDLQRQTLDRLVRSSVLGRDVVVVREGDFDFPFESIVEVPVFRSVDRDATTAEIIERIETGLKSTFRPENTYVLSGAPDNATAHAGLQERGLRGGYDSTWKEPVAALHDILNDGGLSAQKSGALSAKALRKKLKKALVQRHNVLIVVAHADGNTIYFPTSDGEVVGVQADDLREHAEKMRRNKPTVLLLACRTGQRRTAGPADSETVDVSGFGRRLVELGANLVLAPSTNITTAESQGLLRELIARGRETSLVEAAMDVYFGRADGELELPLHFLVDQEGWKWQEKLDSETTFGSSGRAPSGGPRSRSLARRSERD